MAKTIFCYEYRPKKKKYCWKTKENMRKYRAIKFVTRERRKNYLVSETNYHTTKFFKENLLAIVIRKIEILISKLVYLGLSILELSKILMFEFWYDYVKPKHGQKAKLCYIDTDVSLYT